MLPLHHPHFAYQGFYMAVGLMYLFLLVRGVFVVVGISGSDPGGVVVTSFISISLFGGTRVYFFAHTL